MDHLNCAAEFKFANEAKGEFEGYASVFGGRDSYDDQVAPGAFTRTLAEAKAKGRVPPMYMQHGRMLGADPRPVGVWNVMSEDSKGLNVAGRLVGLDTETGKYNKALVAEGAMRGLSIGFKAIKADYPNKVGMPRRILKDVNLFEVSIVDDPADANARITSIKSAKTIREFEDFLRDVGGFSHAAAKSIAAGGFKANADPRDEDVDGEAADLVKRFRALRAA
jgi:HK97 family phage prohead protease